MTAAAVCLAVISAAGCGSGDRSDPERTRGYDSTAVSLSKVVNINRFSVMVPDYFRTGDRGAEYARSMGDESVDLSGDGGNSVLVYRKTGRFQLRLQEFVDLLLETNSRAYGIDTEIKSYKFVLFDEKRAIFLSGRWSHDEYGSGDLRAYGVQCGEYFFIVEFTAVKEWNFDVAAVVNTFHCTED